MPSRPGDVAPALVVTAHSVDTAALERRAEEGVSVITVPENRWARVDIKSTSLLPNVLAKQEAKESGAFEAWFVDAQGFVTEGSSTNAWIVTGRRNHRDALGGGRDPARRSPAPASSMWPPASTIRLRNGHFRLPRRRPPARPS